MPLLELTPRGTKREQAGAQKLAVLKKLRVVWNLDPSNHAVGSLLPRILWLPQVRKDDSPRGRRV
jgi:hypothetical protein